MLCEEVTVNNVDHAVQLLLHKASWRDLQDELCKQFTEREKEREREKKRKKERKKKRKKERERERKRNRKISITQATTTTMENNKQNYN